MQFSPLGTDKSHIEWDLAHMKNAQAQEYDKLLKITLRYPSA